MNKKLLISLYGIGGASLLFALVLTQNGKLPFVFAHADPLQIILDNTKTPTLSDGVGTLVDARGVTWEYKDAASSAGNHVSLQAGGYMRVSSDSAYGITGITSFISTFTASEGDQLDLLVSVDGLDWENFGYLTSNSASEWAKGYRYVGMYANGSNPITISSVNISYSCEGINSVEDVDLASTSNVRYVAVETDLAAGEYFSKSTSTTSFKMTPQNAYDSANLKYHQLNFNLFGGATHSLDDLVERELSLTYDTYSTWTTDSSTSHLVPAICLTNGSTKLVGASRPDYSTFTYDNKAWKHVDVSFATLKGSLSDDLLFTGIRAESCYLNTGDSLTWDSIRIKGKTFSLFPQYTDSDNLTKLSNQNYHGGLHSADITDTDGRGITYNFENTVVNAYSIYSSFYFGTSYNVGNGATQTMTIYFIDETLHITYDSTDTTKVTAVERRHNGRAVRLLAINDADTGSYPANYSSQATLHDNVEVVDSKTGLCKVQIPLSVFTTFKTSGTTQINGICFQTFYKQSDGVSYLSEQGLDTHTYFKLVHTSIA